MGTGNASQVEIVLIVCPHRLQAECPLFGWPDLARVEEPYAAVSRAELATDSKR